MYTSVYFLFFMCVHDKINYDRNNYIMKWTIGVKTQGKKLAYTPTGSLRLTIIGIFMSHVTPLHNFLCIVAHYN